MQFVQLTSRQHQPAPSPTSEANVLRDKPGQSPVISLMATPRSASSAMARLTRRADDR